MYRSVTRVAGNSFWLVPPHPILHLTKVSSVDLTFMPLRHACLNQGPTLARYEGMVSTMLSNAAMLMTKEVAEGALLGQLVEKINGGGDVDRALGSVTWMLSQ